MSPSLIQRLSRIVVDRPTAPPRSREVREWLADNGLLITVGSRATFRANAYVVVEKLLRAQGVKPHEVSVLDSTATRAETRQVAAYEKLSGGVLGRHRVLVRSIPGGQLRLTTDIALPPRTALDISASDLNQQNRHTSIIVVENREAFDHLESLKFYPPIFDQEPIVVFRGSPYVSAGSKLFLERANLPVWVFGDLDPAGVAIAADTPNAVGIISPPFEMIVAEILRAPNRDLYQKQLHKAARIGSDQRPWVQEFWHLIKSAQCAIPQESFFNITNSH